MNDNVSSIRNLGPKMEDAFNAIAYITPKPFAPKAQMKLSTAFKHWVFSAFHWLLRFGHGVAKPPLERLHCNIKQTLGTRFDFLKTKRTLIKARKMQILNALLTK